MYSAKNTRNLNSPIKNFTLNLIYISIKLLKVSWGKWLHILYLSMHSISGKSKRSKLMLIEIRIYFHKDYAVEKPYATSTDVKLKESFESKIFLMSANIYCYNNK